MSELDEIRRRKLEELQNRYEQSASEEQQAQQEIAQLELAVKQRMSKEALQRFGNIKVADPEKAVQLLVILAQLLQSGRLTMIDDNNLRQILAQVTPKKKEFKITRK